MKEFNNHLLKFKITNDKLKMEISLKDLYEGVYNKFDLLYANKWL